MCPRAETLIRLPWDNWDSYESGLQEHPIITKTGINVGIYLIGDWLSQVCRSIVENTIVSREYHLGRLAESFCYPLSFPDSEDPSKREVPCSSSSCALETGTYSVRARGFGTCFAAFFVVGLSTA